MANSLRRGAHGTLRHPDGWAFLHHLPGKLQIAHAHLKEIAAQDIIHTLWDKHGKNTSFKLGVLTPGTTSVASPGFNVDQSVNGRRHIVIRETNIGLVE